jgi:hypothetical protein
MVAWRGHSVVRPGMFGVGNRGYWGKRLGMLNHNDRWRRFDPVEITNEDQRYERGIRDSVLLGAMRQELLALRRTLDLVLDENERLRRECENLRRTGLSNTRPFSAQSGTGSIPTTEDMASRLVRVDQSISDLVIELRALHTQLASDASIKVDAGTAPPNDQPYDPQAQPDVSTIDGLSRIVARWVFPSPSEARVRMVAAAIRNRLRSRT